MTEREQTFDLDTTRLLRARRSADGVVAQYIRELAERRDECRAPAERRRIRRGRPLRSCSAGGSAGGAARAGHECA